MKGLAEKLKNQRAEKFTEFDLAVFAEYLEESFEGKNKIRIGIVWDPCFESGELKKRKQAKETECKWLAFALCYQCGYWQTDCQIPRSLQHNVMAWLSEQGFKVSALAVCGCSDAVIEISL